MPPRNIAKLWLPDGREQFLALLDEGRRMRRSAEADPTYTAGMDQAAAAMADHLSRTGVQLSVPAQSEAFLLGLLVGLGTLQLNDGVDPAWVSGAAMAYGLRAVDGAVR